MARLLVFRGDLLDREVDLGKTPLRIGRGADNDLMLEDAQKGVSRVHAELRFESGRYVLADLNSQNGIWVDGARTDRVALQGNTVAELGPYRLMIDETGGTEVSRSGGTLPPSPHRTNAGRLSRDQTDYGEDPSASRSVSEQPAQSWWAARKKTLLLGGVGVALAAAVGVSTFNSGSGGLTNAEWVEYHLSEARTLIERGSAQLALDEHLEPGLRLEPGNTALLALKQEALERLQAPPPPPTLPSAPPRTRTTDPPKVTGPPTRAAPQVVAPTLTVLDPSQGGLKPQPGEREESLRDRERRMREALEEAKALATAGEYLRAEAQLATIIEEATDRYLDAKATLEALRVTKKQAAQRLLNEAMQDAEARRFDQAIDKLKRAGQYDPSLDTATPMREITARRIQLGEDAFARAGVAYKIVGSEGEALKLYEQAVAWLPRDHPSVPEAERRIKELKR